MRFGIKQKMIIGYLPIILLIFVIDILTTRSLNKLNLINRSIINEDTFLIQATGKMEDAILAQESYGRRYLILDSLEMLDLFRQRDREFNELVTKIRTLPHQDEIPIEELVSAHDDFNTLYTTPLALPGKDNSLISGDFDEIVRRKFDQMMVLLQQMHKVGKKNQYLKMEKANRIGIQAFRLTTFLSTLGILLGLAAVFTITRSIFRAILELKRATEIISEGKYDYCLQIETNDELGDLARSLRLMSLRLSLLEKISLDSSPLTRMPGGLAIENILSKRLEMDKDLAFCMLDLDNFKSYNDQYGYAKGNEVIKATAAIIKSVVTEYGGKEDFVGHIGGDDFAIVTSTAKYETICKEIINRFDENIIYFYNETDRKQGHINAKSRQGSQMRFPIMTISIAVVATEQGQQMNQIEIGEIAAELKEYAKSITGSVFVTNRRGKNPTHDGAQQNMPLKLIQQGKHI